MKPRLATLAAYACAGLFMLSLFACAASRGRGHPFPVLPFWWGKDVRLAIATDRTSWGVYYVRELDRAVLPDDWGDNGVRHSAFGFELEWIELGVRGLYLKSAARYGTAAAPTALVLPLLAAFPIRHFHRRRTARHPARSGLCLHCGYDLRSSPDRCPECGSGAK